MYKITVKIGDKIIIFTSRDIPEALLKVEEEYKEYVSVYIENIKVRKKEKNNG